MQDHLSRTNRSAGKSGEETGAQGEKDIAKSINVVVKAREGEKLMRKGGESGETAKETGNE